MQLIVLQKNATVLDCNAMGMKVDGGEACKVEKRRVGEEEI
jgi:hypothetical protein